MSKAKQRLIPVHVLRAINEEDISALKAMGRRGGLNSATQKRKRCERNEILAQMCKNEDSEEEYKRVVGANEHICPVDN